MDAQIKDYTKRAQVKGFRPGKVPVGMVKKMYGKGILADEINKTLGKVVDGYVKDNNLRLLGEPLPVASDVNFDTAKDFDFQFELGLLPEVELPSDGTVEVERHQVSLDDDTVQQTNEQIARQYGETSNPDASEANDYLVGKLKKVDADGEGRALSFPINKVKNGVEQFVNVKPGDVLTFDLKNTFAGDTTAITNFLGLTRTEATEANGEYVLSVEKINRTAAPGDEPGVV